ncbi:Protein of unknown function DUF3048, C-terminal domain containing protein [Candidatus Nanopelagicaceae bacterium]
MSFKKLLKRSAGLASIAVVAIALFNFLPSIKVVSLIPILGKIEPTNSLSGRIGSDGPILVVKIDDTPPAHPQAGLEDADVVYIEQVEGGLTRLAAVFSSNIPKVVGPVRSARISDIEILQQYGRVAFAYSGAQSKLLPVIAAANLENLGAQRQSPEIYANDPLRIAPTAMMLQAQKLMANVAEAKLPIALSKSIGWSFGDGPDTGTAISSVKVSWPANSYDATWSISQERWLLSQRGVPDLSASGWQLGPTTFVIQLVAITASEYHDKIGGVTPFSSTVGTGTGYVLRDGLAIAANWTRPTADEGTKWIDKSGREIKFASGQIWIALTDKEPIFTAKFADAPSPASK